MAIDTPARIVILGAGPIGLEAALYARFLGYEVDLYERGTVAENPRRWGHVRMFSPFGLNCSPLGLSALRAQNSKYIPPDGLALLTGAEWADRYLLPLSRTDLLADSIHQGATVLGVARDGPLKGDLIGDAERSDYLFRILLRDASGRESATTADVVIDTTGTFGNPNALGIGGLPAIGELALRNRIDYGLPNPLGSDSSRYSGRRTLVVGSGFSAATTVVALAELAARAPDTQVLWLTRGPGSAPIHAIADDRLPARAELAAAANRLAAGASPHITHCSGLMVEAIEAANDDGPLTVHVLDQSDQRTTWEVDAIVANVGYRPDRGLYRELQVHECYASEGPMKLAASLLSHASADCLDQPNCGVQALFNPEAHFYILGAKSYGRASSFLVHTGLRQIRDLFQVIGDRPDLDLYQSPL